MNFYIPFFLRLMCFSIANHPSSNNIYGNRSPALNLPLDCSHIHPDDDDALAVVKLLPSGFVGYTEILPYGSIDTT